jgi:hypothetical protein
MSNNVKEILIETARRKRKVPKVLNVPELPLDAPDFETYLERLEQPQPIKTDGTDQIFNT